MHGEAREKSIQSHLKLVEHFSDEELNQIETLHKLIHYWLFKKPKLLWWTYVKNVLKTLGRRRNVSPEVLRQANAFLTQERQRIKKSYQMKVANQKIFDNEGKETTVESLLGEECTKILKKCQQKDLPPLSLDQAENVLIYLEKEINLKDWYTPAGSVRVQTMKNENIFRSTRELYLLLRTIYVNGARRREIYSFRYDTKKLQILLKEGRVFIKGKSKIKQEFLLDPDTLKLYRLYISLFGALFTFGERTHTNRYISVLQELKLFGKVKPEIKVWRNLYSYRASKVNPKMCSQIMNHASSFMTQRYVNHVAPHQTKDKMEFITQLGWKSQAN